MLNPLSWEQNLNTSGLVVVVHIEHQRVQELYQDKGKISKLRYILFSDLDLTWHYQFVLNDEELGSLTHSSCAEQILITV